VLCLTLAVLAAVFRPEVQWRFTIFSDRSGIVSFLKKDQAINYAENRASFRSGEIRIVDSSGDVEHTIAPAEGIETHI
jgi:hypothetical protein